MRVNNVIAKMKAGEKAYGCSLTFPSTAVVELIGMAGLDHVSFDSEHGPFTPESIDDLCRVADMAGLTPMARVPNIDSSTILRFLDRGIMGITGPHITTGERAQQLADALTFYLAGSDVPVMLFPDWETLPYDNFSPHQDIISDRLRTLYHMAQLRSGIIVVSVTSLMYKLPPKAYIAANSFDLEIGQLLHIDAMRKQLISAGYQSVDSVYEHGEFAVRGSIIDIFPMGSAQPFRIDLFDDEIETLRNFDPETQRSNDKVDAIRLLPGREFPLDEQGSATFRGQFRDLFDIAVRQCAIYSDVSCGISSTVLAY